MGRGAEAVAAMDQGHVLGQGLQVQRPVQRRVAAAVDHDALAAEALHLTHGVVHADARALVLEQLDAGRGGLLGLEGAAAGGDHQHRGLDGGLAIGCDPPLALGRLGKRRRHLVQVEHRIEGGDLLEQPLGQLLAGDDRIAGNVVDRLLRIELGALAAGLVQDVDDVGLHVEQAQLEDREQADRAGAHDDHVGGVALAGFGLGEGVRARVVHGRPNFPD